MSFGIGTVLSQLLWLVVSLPSAVNGELQVSSALMDRASVVVVGVVSAAVFLVVVILLLTNCNDCYNSEVSTDTHPATCSSGVKWGGAGGYSSAACSNTNDHVLGAGFTAEVINPGHGGNQPLPYAMIPTQVPEAQGFRGYKPVGSSGVSGYGALQGEGEWGESRAGVPGSRNMPGAHFSPSMQQEPQGPPPAYREVAYH